MNTPTDKSTTRRMGEVTQVVRTLCVTPYLAAAIRFLFLPPRNAPLFAARRRHVLGPSQSMGDLEIPRQQGRLPALAPHAASGPFDKLLLGTGQQVRVGQ